MPDHFSFFSPKKLPDSEAFQAVSHLGIGAHPDDLEILAYHGIESCYKNSKNCFGGVTVTTGGGSMDGSEQERLEYIQRRKKEQFEAAKIGEYAFQIMLNRESSELENQSQSVIEDLIYIIEKVEPEVIYTHNPFDKHLTHVRVFSLVMDALQVSKHKPKKLFGCEVWRGLDWLSDSHKVVLPVDKYPKLGIELLEVFESQMTSQKRYDLATLGRRKANSTFLDSHGDEESQYAIYAVDLLPILNEEMNVRKFVDRILLDFSTDIRNACASIGGGSC